MSLLAWRPESADLVLLVVRVLFAVACFTHGWGKVTGIEGFRAKWGLALPVAWAVALTQTVGAVLIGVGFAHGWACLAMAICGAGITWMQAVVAKEPFAAPGQHSWDMGMMYTLLPLLLMVTGPGRYALLP